MKHRAWLLNLVLGCVILATRVCGFEDGLPVRGLHLFAPSPAELDLLIRFIREACPREGVNTLVLQIDYSFQYMSRPEMSTAGALDREQARRIVAACREAGVRLIPQISCLGHQSWKGENGLLLKKHPHLDETPGKYPGNRGIYCRSYCPLHPEVHGILFALIDEICDVFEADAFHAGMDEVFILADPDCPRCKGKDRAELFGGEIRAIRDHLAQNQRTLWIWGDRLLDDRIAKTGKWEADRSGTHRALDQAPKDIVICDWHYHAAPATAAHFASNGFFVVSSPWRKPTVALRQLDQIREGRKKPEVGPRMLGMLQTTWCSAGDFIRAYYGDAETRKKNKYAAESADCFRKLFAAMRGE